MTEPALRAPIAAALAAAAAKPAEAEQLALLPAPSKFGDATNRGRVVREHIARSDRGRPPGATNLAKRHVLDFVRKTIGDPLLERARWLRHTPASLALELGCTELEAFDRLDRIQSELSRFFYAPLAPVDAEGNAVVPSFHMSIGGGSAGAPGGTARPPWVYGDLVDVTPENSTKSMEAVDVSHGDVSHEQPK